MGEDELRAILLSKRKLEKLPIATNVDFGHTYPHITIPIGGMCDLSAEGSQVQLTFTLH
jgi:muramoyltetrapeptide carboxypeptidase LdcA involved in peptidoglycan recycling